MTRSNELGIPIWLSTSRLAPPTDILRTKQSIPEPSNEIVPTLMTFWRWVSRLSITTALCQAFQFLLYTEAMIAARPAAPLRMLEWNSSRPKAVVCVWFAASRPCIGSLIKWVYRNEVANNSSGVGYDYRLGRRSVSIRICVCWRYLQV